MALNDLRGGATDKGDLYAQLAPTFHHKWRLRCCTPEQMRGWLSGPWPGDMRPNLARFCEEARASVCQELAEQGLCVRQPAATREEAA